MRRFSSLVIVGLIGLLGLVLSTLLGYIPNLYPVFQERPWLLWISIGGIILVLCGYSLSEWRHKNAVASDLSAEQRQAERNRRTMLEKVWSIWIEGVLKASLHHEALITLGMQHHPDAVRPPVDIMIQRSQHDDQPFPPNTRIVQVFDEVGQALLILGAPGSGKTTLLLELARDLIERAGRDATHPIPVVFPLSTWAATRRPLDTWFVDELVDRYAVSRKLAHTWITNDRVLPLLDGLDEVALSTRDACVEAINAFRATHGNVSIAVCSRIQDYDQLTVRLRLYSAIMVQPLSREQVRKYVGDIGFPFRPSSTSPLWELLDTPLMLNIATLAYVDQPADALRPIGGVTDMQEQIIASYVERRLSQAPDSPSSAAQTKHYLSWLAWQMQQHNQTVFYLERMQPDWLPYDQYWVLRLLYTLLISLLSGLLVALVIGLFSGLLVTLVGGVFVGLVIGLLGGLFLGQEITLTDRVQWSWTGMRRDLLIVLLLGLTGGLSGWLFGVRYAGLFGAMVGGVFGTLVGGLGTGLLLGLSQMEVDHRTKPNQGIRHSGQSALLVGLLSAPLLWLLVELIYGLIFAQLYGSLFALVGGLIVALVGGLLLALGSGGEAWLCHYLVRLLLIRQSAIPWRYIPFLNFATQRILLRNVGGGYIFIHRLLLDYFAKQYTGPEVTATPH